MIRRAGTTVLILGAIPLAGCAVYGDSGAYYPVATGYYESPGYYVSPGHSTTYVPYPVYYGSSHYYYESYRYPRHTHEHDRHEPRRPAPPVLVRPDRDSHGHRPQQHRPDEPQGRGYDRDHRSGRDHVDRDSRDRHDSRGRHGEDRSGSGRPEAGAPARGRPPQVTPRPEPPRRVQAPPPRAWSNEDRERLRAAVRDQGDRREQQRGSPRAAPEPRTDRQPGRFRNRLQTDEP